MVMKLYLRLESTKKFILYNTIKYTELIRVDESMFLFLFQETAFQLILKQDRDRLRKYPLLIAIINIIIYL
jgi:hypothetical protein